MVPISVSTKNNMIIDRTKIVILLYAKYYDFAVMYLVLPQ